MPDVHMLANSPLRHSAVWRRTLALLWLACCGCNSILGNENRVPVYQGDPAANQQLDTDAGSTDLCANLNCGAFGICQQTSGSAACECTAGYVEDAGVCRDEDECASGNGGCGDNAVCINLSGKRECVCRAGYAHPDGGDELCVSLCDAAGCDQHAGCTIVGDRALCTCLAPYTGNGLNCTFDDACAGHDCDQNARCLGGGPNPCVCSDGFMGDGTTCTHVDACAAKPCQNNGACSNENGTFFCNCADTGFRGTRCDEAIDDCSPNPCQHGKCKDDIKAYSCTCVDGYEGQNCDQDKNDCATQPCQHGVCQDLVGDYKCMCEAGYSGKDCSNTDDNCAGTPCARGKCVNQVAGYMCECPAGYDGKNCENNTNDCAAKPCVHGVCSDKVAGYECSCESGYEGKNCETNEDDCADAPCVHGTCVDQVNGYSCACSTGWGGTRCDQGSCSNVNCAKEAPCVVPDGAAGICYPWGCGEDKGLCLAEKPDGAGAATSDPIEGKNSDFDGIDGNDWTKRARYFVYLKPKEDRKFVCVYPEEDYKGTPIKVKLGQSMSTPEGFGQSNAWPGEESCPDE